MYLKVLELMEKGYDVQIKQLNVHFLYFTIIVPGLLTRNDFFYEYLNKQQLLFDTNKF